MKKMLLLLVCLTTFAWLHADEVTFDFMTNAYGVENTDGAGTPGANNDTYFANPTTATSSPVSIKFAKTSGNGWRFYNDGVRFYKGNASLTISANGATITAIKLAGATANSAFSSYTLNGGTSNAVTSADLNIECNTTEAVLAFSKTTSGGKAAFKTITVTYTPAGSPTQVPTPSFNPAPGAVEAGTKVTISCSDTEAEIHYTTNGDDPTAESAIYTAETDITVNEAMTVKAIAVKEGLDKSEIATATYTPFVAMPTFSVEAGAVQPNTEVAISCTTSGATIKYSLNGSTEFIEYTDPIVITEATTINAYAIVGSLKSENAEASYSLVGKLEEEQTETLVFSNEYSLDTDLNGVTIKLNDYISITFSKNGGDNPPKYYKSGSALRMYPKNKFAITAVDGIVVKSIVFATPANYNTLESSSTQGYANGYWSGNESEVTFVESRTSGQSRITNIAITYAPKTAANQVEIPVFSHEEGEIIKGTPVEITCPTEGATIHYTTDGTEPTKDSPVYSGPIEVNADMTIKAIAVKDGLENSYVAEITYLVVLDTVATPIFDPVPGSVVTKDTEVTITCATEGAKIYYRVNGGDLLEGESGMTIVISEATIIEVIAKKEGYNDSESVTASYSVEGEAPINPTAIFDFTQPGTLQPAFSAPTFDPSVSNPAQNLRVYVDEAQFYNNYTLIKFNSREDAIYSNRTQLWNVTEGVQLRTYNGSTITVTVAENLTIEHIEFTSATDKSYLANIAYKGTLGSYSTSTGIWSRGAVNALAAEDRESVTFNISATTRLNAIKVTTAGTPTGVEDVTVDENAPVEYYNLQGVRVANPENGIYIRRQGSKVSKVLVK